MGVVAPSRSAPSLGAEPRRRRGLRLPQPMRCPRHGEVSRRLSVLLRAVSSSTSSIAQRLLTPRPPPPNEPGIPEPLLRTACRHLQVEDEVELEVRVGVAAAAVQLCVCARVWCGGGGMAAEVW